MTTFSGRAVWIWCSAFHLYYPPWKRHVDVGALQRSRSCYKMGSRMPNNYPTNGLHGRHTTVCVMWWTVFKSLHVLVKPYSKQHGWDGEIVFIWFWSSAWRPTHEVKTCPHLQSASNSSRQVNLYHETAISLGLYPHRNASHASGFFVVPNVSNQSMTQLPSSPMINELK